jgi:hypothetical protein
VSWASRPASVSTPISTSTTRTRHRAPEANRSCDAAPGHSRTFDARGAKPAPRGASSNRAGGRTTG